MSEQCLHQRVLCQRCSVRQLEGQLSSRGLKLCEQAIEFHLNFFGTILPQNQVSRIFGGELLSLRDVAFNPL